MNKEAGRLYGWLYDRGTAAALVLLSGLLLATGQTRTIVDAVALVHPGWGSAWAWIVAVGFETAILAVGLVMASTGDRDLWRWEVVLVGASVVAGLAVGMHGHALQDYGAWARGLAMGLLPVQYLAVVLTGHKLAGAGPNAGRPIYMDMTHVRSAKLDMGQEVAAEGSAMAAAVGPGARIVRDGRYVRASWDFDGKGGGVAPVVITAELEPGPGAARDSSKFYDTLTGKTPERPLGFMAAAAERQRAPGRGRKAPDLLPLLREAPEGLGVEARDAWVAKQAGVSAKTVQRQRVAAGL